MLKPAKVGVVPVHPASARTPGDRSFPTVMSLPRERLRRIESGLFLIALVCLGYGAFVSVDAWRYQAQENRRIDELRQSIVVAGARSEGREASSHRPRNGEVIGRIEIPRLGVAAVIAEGVDARTLRRAVGHLPGTVLPGQTGNAGLAGHRDTYFRALREIRENDSIRIVTPVDRFEYRVDFTAVVSPTRADLLSPTDDASLTLITCHPFYYVGPAPERFVVRAHRVEQRDSRHSISGSRTPM
jgi:sortase A